MERRTRARAVAIALISSLGVGGCNTVLGIEEPIEQAGPPGQAYLPREGGVGTEADIANSIDTPADADAHGTTRGDFAYGWAEWPMPNPASVGLPNAQSYDTLSLTNVTIDLITGLQWQRAVDTDPYAWKDALAYCEGLTVSGGGWRLPSRIELMSLVDYTSANPVIDVAAFPDTPADSFWTSSIFAGDPASAWEVTFKFNDGMADQNDMAKLLRVRCVR